MSSSTARRSTRVSRAVANATSIPPPSYGNAASSRRRKSDRHASAPVATRNWAKVLRPPNEGVAFLVPTWVPISQLTPGEREIYDKKRAAAAKEKKELGGGEVKKEEDSKQQSLTPASNDVEQFAEKVENDSKSSSCIESSQEGGEEEPQRETISDSTIHEKEQAAPNDDNHERDESKDTITENMSDEERPSKRAKNDNDESVEIDET
uniref:Uncharacterized protein n=2 Tax=Ditylum brightwellii TaxID=49249 RepID=A0A7S4V3K3_9STRA